MYIQYIQGLCQPRLSTADHAPSFLAYAATTKLILRPLTKRKTGRSLFCLAFSIIGVLDCFLYTKSLPFILLEIYFSSALQSER
jgi:hypothetical protein